MQQPLADPDEAQGKGTNFNGALRSLERTRGKAVREQVEAALRGPVGEAVRSGQLLAVGWYPVSWYLELQRTMQEVTGEGPSLTRELAAVATADDFTALHKLVIRALSAETVAKHAHRLLTLYWRGGTIVIANASKDMVLARFSGWNGFGAILWEDMAGSISAILSLVGARPPRVRIVAASRDGRDADIEARFG